MGHMHLGGALEGELKPFDSRMFFRLMGYLRPYRWWLAGSLASLFVAAVAAQAGPYLLGRAIDEFINPAGPAASLPMDARLGGLDLYALLFAGSLIVTWLAEYGETYCMSWAAQNSIFDLRSALFRHLQRLGLKWFDARPAGVIMSRVINDVQTLDELLSSGLTTVFGDLVRLLVIVTIMLGMNVRLALASFITIPPLLLMVFYFRPRILQAHRQVRTRVAEINANLQESISGVRVTKSFVREEENFEEFSLRNQNNYDATVAAEFLMSIFQPGVMLIGALGTAVVLWYGGSIIMRETLDGLARGTLGPGTLAAFLVYVQRFNHPLQNLSSFYTQMQSAMASCEKIFAIMDTDPGVKDAPGSRDLPPIQGRVHFEDVDFAYEGENLVLRNADLRVEPGSRVALVGHTGAGKSTMINLLCRFYDPVRGRVTVDGHDLREVTLQSLRSQLGIVLQDTFLFSGSVRDNIAYGKLDADDGEIRRAALAVNAHAFIEELPAGYDTPVGERGGNLSVGERQLISFARALLRDPGILILDEATSSVDAYTELLIQRALDTLLEGRTSFIIAHRLSTIRNADQIVVLEDGRIVEWGTHSELIRAGGHYAELYRVQFATE